MRSFIFRKRSLLFRLSAAGPHATTEYLSRSPKTSDREELFSSEVFFQHKCILSPSFFSLGGTCPRTRAYLRSLCKSNRLVVRLKAGTSVLSISNYVTQLRPPRQSSRFFFCALFLSSLKAHVPIFIACREKSHVFLLL